MMRKLLHHGFFLFGNILIIKCLQLCFCDQRVPFINISCKYCAHEILNLRMYELSIVLSFKIGQRTAVCKVFSIVDFCCGDHITDHFAGIGEGHETAVTTFVLTIDPVLPVMFVTAFVMHPCFTVAI